MIIQSESLEWLKNQEADSIDHIITDPPYLIDFMGKEWDNEKNVAGSVEYWKEALRVCKAGSYALVFGHSRTHHRVMTAMEDAGWEIRDTIMWLYGSGFPKSHNIGKKHSEWEGWGSALKPAYEPIIVARKPFKGTLANNVLKNGLGGLNIDATRVLYTDDYDKKHQEDIRKGTGTFFGGKGVSKSEQIDMKGRFPANIILDEEAGKLLDKQSGITQSAKQPTKPRKQGFKSEYVGGDLETREELKSVEYGDKGGASRFFYVAKVSSKERNFGCEELEDKKFVLNESIKDQSRLEGGVENDLGWNRQKIRKNTHPTLKPIELMKYLVKLVSKEGQTILDPFAGSGSTGIAVELLGRNFIGIEMNEEYCDIAERRITAWREKENATE